MKKVLLLIALMFSVAAFSQKKLSPDAKEEQIKLENKYEFQTKIDTIKCSFLYVSSDGYIVSDRGYLLRSYLHSEKIKKDIDLAQVLVNDKGEVIEQKDVVQIVQKDWKPEK